MLFVEASGRRVMSMRARDCPGIFLRDGGPMTIEAARLFLRGFQQDDFWFQQALRDELQAGSGSSGEGIPRFGNGTRDLLETAACAIAAGTMRIATPLGGHRKIVFDPKRPWSSPLGAVGFPTRGLAHRFTDGLLHDREAAAVLRAALRHVAAEHARRLIGDGAVNAVWDVPRPHGAGPGETMLDDLVRNGWTVARITTLFAREWLLLVPVSMGARTLRLAWPRRGAGASQSEAPEDMPPPPPRREAAPSGPRSVVPDGALVPSAQALALMAAAAAGVPFCQDCPPEKGAKKPVPALV